MLSVQNLRSSFEKRNKKGTASLPLLPFLLCRRCEVAPAWEQLSSLDWHRFSCPCWAGPQQTLRNNPQTKQILLNKVQFFRASTCQLMNMPSLSCCLVDVKRSLNKMSCFTMCALDLNIFQIKSNSLGPQKLLSLSPQVMC